MSSIDLLIRYGPVRGLAMPLERLETRDFSRGLLIRGTTGAALDSESVESELFDWKSSDTREKLLKVPGADLQAKVFLLAATQHSKSQELHKTFAVYSQFCFEVRSTFGKRKNNKRHKMTSFDLMSEIVSRCFVDIVYFEV